MRKIAIIGGGISGTVVASRLSQLAEVTLFEKARGLGGRLSTRQASPFSFDHGAQFFAAKTEEFRRFLEGFVKTGDVAQWSGPIIKIEDGRVSNSWISPYFVGVPGMNSLCKTLIRSCGDALKVHVGCEVAPLENRQNGQWILKDREGRTLGAFDWVVSTAPFPQTRCLFGKHLDENPTISPSEMAGFYSLMVGIPQPWEREWIAADVRGRDIQWISVNSSKPGRDAQVTSLVIQSNAHFAKNHLEQNTDIEDVQKMLLSELVGLINIDVQRVSYISTHRWRYGRAVPSEYSKGIDADLKLAVAGDWFQSVNNGAVDIERAWYEAQRVSTLLTEML